MTGTMDAALPVAAFEYELPPDRIARHPEPRRDGSRLLVMDPDRDAFGHLRFDRLDTLVRPGDLLVLNESRVLPARLLGRKPTGAPAEILLLRPLGSSGVASTRWEALVRPGSKLKPGRRVEVAEDLAVEIEDSTPGGGRVVRLVTDLTVPEALDRHGRMPLPPYLDREPDEADRERYQTVYARVPGSVAAPTAGLHFTPDLLGRLEASGVEVASIVLHVGVGTFRPVEVEDPAEHRMHMEWYHIPLEAADSIRSARSRGGRVWAVGTTVMRTLESAAEAGGQVRSGEGETNLFIRPPFDFRVVDALVTNFHLPRSTLLMLVAAFGGYERTMDAYAEAIRSGYRFYSYGDAMAVLGTGSRR